MNLNCIRKEGDTPSSYQRVNAGIQGSIRTENAQKRPFCANSLARGFLEVGSCGAGGGQEGGLIAHILSSGPGEIFTLASDLRGRMGSPMGAMHTRRAPRRA